MSLVLLKLLRKFLKALVSASTPRQIAMAFSLGAFIGITPTNSALSILIIVFLFIFNINFSAGLISAGLFSLFSHLLFPLAHKIGVFLLIKQTGLYQFWTTLYNLPLFPFFNFNNTIMLGSLIIAGLIQVPLYFFIKHCIIFYRKNLHEKLQKLKIIQTIKASFLGQWVFKLWQVFK
jgi:uncharacterized protein (TIGR03546 family)